MIPRIYIVMPVSRPENLGRIAQYYLSDMEPHPFEIRWLIGMQGPEPDPKGINKENELIDMIPGVGWFLTQADDTFHDPSLFRRIAEIIEANPNAGLIAFSGQRGPGGVLNACPENACVCHMCGSQIVIKKEFMGSDRFNYQEHGVLSDGRMIEHLKAKDPSRIVYVDELLTYFNRMEWDTI